MSATMWLALLLQVTAVALLRLGLGKLWLGRPVSLLVLASLAYDGVSQVLLAFPSIAAWDIFRLGIDQGYIDEADLIMSAGMLGLTITYLLARGAPHDAPPSEDDATFAARVLDWRLLALACAPLAVLTYEGRGYNDGSLATGAGAGTATSLAAQFFVPLVALAAFALLLRCGTRWFLPVLAAQSILLAAAGERTPVIIDALALIVLLGHCGQRPRRSHLHAAVALTVLALLAITGLRAVQGRSVFYADSGLRTRVAALGAGISAAPAAGTPSLAAQAAQRLDGTAFAGAVLQAEHYGQPRLVPAAVPESLLLVVPSAVWPGKLSSAALDPYPREIGDFGLQRANLLPGLAGLYVGFLSAPWLIMFLGALGALCGRGERWLLRCRTPVRLVLLAGAVDAALCYEKGLPGMLVALRAAIVIAVIVRLGEAALRRRKPAVSCADTDGGATSPVAADRCGARERRVHAGARPIAHKALEEGASLNLFMVRSADTQ
jgi:hypothetical protein